MLLVLAWLSCSIFFSTSFIGSNVISHYSMPLEYMMFYRLMISSLFILFIILLRRQRILIRKNEVIVSILVASSQLNVWLATYGTKYLISGLVACVSLLQIFVAEVLSSVVEKRRMRNNIIVSGILGLIGVALLCNKQFVGIENLDIKNTLLGIFFSFIATVAAAGGNLIYEKSGYKLREMPRTTFLLYNCFFAGIFFLLLGFITAPTKELLNPAIFDKKYLGVMTYLAITATVLALFGLYYIIEKQGAVKSTYVVFVYPVISMIISTFVEGYEWDVMAVFGMIILLYSVWVGVRQKTEYKNNQTIWQKIFHLIVK